MHSQSIPELFLLIPPPFPFSSVSPPTPTEDAAAEGSAGIPKEGITGIILSAGGITEIILSAGGITGIILSAQAWLLLSSPEEAPVDTRAMSGCACGEDNGKQPWMQLRNSVCSRVPAQVGRREAQAAGECAAQDANQPRAACPESHSSSCIQRQSHLLCELPSAS